MTHRRWWWVGIVGIFMITGALVGCGGGDGDDGDDSCFLFDEVEPNDTELNAQVLGDLFFGDCFVVEGSVFDALDEDSYRVFVREDLTLFVTLDHSLSVDFDIQIFNADTGELIEECRTGLVPEVCAVTFDVISGDIAVDVVVISDFGAGTYTLEFSAE
jgi:hypothetical protein